MSHLVLESGNTAQWQSLVSDAEQAAHLQLDETMESYLVFTLMRFCQRPDMADSIMALEFLEALNQEGLQHHDRLRDVGDKCLLVSGLFPLLARRRQVDISYFINIGRSAYQQLHEKAHSVYGRLAADFVPMMDVLHALREMNPAHAPLSLLESYQLWENDHSQRARQRLEEQFPTQSQLMKNSHSTTRH